MVLSGRILTTLVVLFMLFDTFIHITRPAPVVAAMARFGFPVSLALTIGIIELFRWRAINQHARGFTWV